LSEDGSVYALLFEAGIGLIASIAGSGNEFGIGGWIDKEAVPCLKRGFKSATGLTYGFDKGGEGIGYTTRG
jgi:hypothetical protein